MPTRWFWVTLTYVRHRAHLDVSTTARVYCQPMSLSHAFGPMPKSPMYLLTSPEGSRSLLPTVASMFLHPPFLTSRLIPQSLLQVPWDVTGTLQKHLSLSPLGAFEMVAFLTDVLPCLGPVWPCSSRMVLSHDEGEAFLAHVGLSAPSTRKVLMSSLCECPCVEGISVVGIERGPFLKKHRL